MFMPFATLFVFCETSFLTLRELHKLQMSENKVDPMQQSFFFTYEE
jgi:hypothetical protein